MNRTLSIGKWIGIMVLACAPMAAALATPLTMNITYFTIATSDPDVNNLGFGTVNNEVQSNLGTNGLPVLNTAAFGCTSNCFTLTPFPSDVTSVGEITWWSPTLNSNVTQTSTSTVTLPFSRSSDFFPPDGTGNNDLSGFQSAILSATLSVPSNETISFSIGADDAAFAFLDGTVVCNLGGVHAVTTGTCVTPFEIGAGNHSLQVFFADLNKVQSGLIFDITTQGITTPPTSVPEPAELGLFGLGLLLIGAFTGLIRRKRIAVR